MEVEQDHMVMSGRYGGQEGDGCHSHIVVSSRRDARKSGRMESITNDHLLFVMGALIL